MMICGIACIFTPLLTLLDMTYFIAILAAVYGIAGIIRSARIKRYGLYFVFSILSIIFGIAVLFLPNLVLVADAMLIYMVAAWLVVQGVVSIVTAVGPARRAGSGMWVLLLIIGILAILLGCYSFVHPQVIAISLGFLIGFWFIETGLSMIFIGAAAD